MTPITEAFDQWWRHEAQHHDTDRETLARAAAVWALRYARENVGYLLRGDAFIEPYHLEDAADELEGKK